MTELYEPLAKKQKITNKQRDNLEVLYTARDELLELAHEDKNLKANGKFYVDEMRQLEFNLQHNWNFPMDELFHTHWNLFAKCTCPQMDNNERFGLPKIINSSCPFHGFEINVNIVEGK